MNDTELANRVVGLGVGSSDHDYYELEYQPEKENSQRITGYVKAESFVRDWRIAGALMEEWPNVEIWRTPCKGMWMFHCGTDVDSNGCRVGICSNESLPRAIIEACASALDQGVHK